MTIRENLKLIKTTTTFQNPHKTEGFREGMAMAEKICDEAVNYREPLKATVDSDGVLYCSRCGVVLGDMDLFCCKCGQAVSRERS